MSKRAIRWARPPVLIAAAGAVLILKVKNWSMFNTYSLYAEYQLWFISSDISAGFIGRLAFGARVGLF